MIFAEKEKIKEGIIDILLIPPAVSSFFSTGPDDFIPLGLLALVASLRAKGYNPEIYKPGKGFLYSMYYSQIAKDIVSKKPKIIGFSTWCTSYPDSILISRHIKSLQPGIPIIFGGPQASILRQETLLAIEYVDYILAGEADFTLPQLVELLLGHYQENDLLKLPGLSFRQKDGSICHNKESGIVPYPDDLPVPAYDLIKGKKSCEVDAGRGCPFKCSYCTTNSFFSKKHRTKSTERIISEMNFLNDNYGIKKFSFTHDLFTLNGDFTTEFCHKLTDQSHKSGRKYTWTCSSRIDLVSKDLLCLMKNAGCRAIFFGIESGSEKIQLSIGKKLRLSRVKEITEFCRNIGIETYTSFIAGFPDEKEDDIEKTLQMIFALATNGVYTQISDLSLLPGTPLYQQYYDQLKFDGLFSNFSESIKGKDELMLIRQYPLLFSSFYYLPNKTIDRIPQHYLCSLINLQVNFINTLFLLRDSLIKDINGGKLLDLYLNYFNSIKKRLESGDLPVIIWVQVLKDYLKSKKENDLCPEIYDVFIYESTKAMLQAQYVLNRLLHTGNSSLHNVVSGVTPSVKTPSPPIWQIIMSSFNLKTVLPSENGWKNPRGSSGYYFYLLIAISEKKCKLMSIKSNEYDFLKINTEQIVQKESPGQCHETINCSEVFLKRMKRLGIV